jgi:cephalosporin hydroxylase
MKLIIDSVAGTLVQAEGDSHRSIDLYSKEAFELLSQLWLKTGWNQKYTYTFTWLGRPIIQLPEDMVRLQEVIYKLQPDVIVETGVAHGGSLVFSASLLKLIGRGRVIGIDVEIRPHNRQAIEAHELAPLITLIEGDSVAPETLGRVMSVVGTAGVVLVLLDSNHSKQHVLAELEAYKGLVTDGSYIVATDGIMKDLTDVPRGESEWAWDNPYAAAMEFLERNNDFVMEQPAWTFNESNLNQNVTHWPGAWLRKLEP